MSAPGGSGPGAVIRSIAATGFINVDSVVVVRTFGLAPGQPYDPKEVRSGVRRLFATGLFTDVTVSDAPTPDGGVALTIHVSERPRVKEIVFRGAKKIEASTLKGKLTVAEGQLLDAGTLELDARKIEAAYGEEGYAHARVVTRTEPSGAGAMRVVFDVQEGPKVKVRGIVFHGNQTMKPEALAKAMESKTPGFLRSGAYKPERRDKDETKLRLYMRTRGHKDADVDSIVPADTPEGSGVILHVFLREGPQYQFGDISWSGNTSVPTPALTASTVPKPGAIYNEAQIQKTLENAYTMYQEQGYLFLSIEPKMTDRDSAVDVVFQITEGSRSRVASLEIVGNTRTKENVIRREDPARHLWARVLPGRERRLRAHGGQRGYQPDAQGAGETDRHGERGRRVLQPVGADGLRRAGAQQSLRQRSERQHPPRAWWKEKRPAALVHGAVVPGHPALHRLRYF